jgi:hypothetical protein
LLKTLSSMCQTRRPEPGRNVSEAVCWRFSTRKYSVLVGEPSVQRRCVLKSVFTSRSVMVWFSVSVIVVIQFWLALHPGVS